MKPFLFVLSCILLCAVCFAKQYAAVPADYNFDYDLNDFNYGDLEDYYTDSYSDSDWDQAYYDDTYASHSPSFDVYEYGPYDQADVYSDLDGSYEPMTSGYGDYEPYTDYESNGYSYDDYEPVDYYDAGYEPTDYGYYDDGESFGYDEYPNSMDYMHDNYDQYAEGYQPVEYGYDDYTQVYKDNELYGEEYPGYSSDRYYPEVDYEGYNAYGNDLYTDYSNEHFAHYHGGAKEREHFMDYYSSYHKHTKPYGNGEYEVYNDDHYGEIYSPYEHYETNDYNEYIQEPYKAEGGYHGKHDYNQWVDYNMQPYVPEKEAYGFQKEYRDSLYAPKPLKGRKPVKKFDRYGKDQSSLVYVPKQDGIKPRFTNYDIQSDVRYPNIGSSKHNSFSSYPMYESNKEFDNYDSYKPRLDYQHDNFDWSKSKANQYKGPSYGSKDVYKNYDKELQKAPTYNDYVDRKSRKAFPYSGDESKRRKSYSDLEGKRQKSISYRPHKKENFNKRPEPYTNDREYENEKLNYLKSYELSQQKEYDDYKSMKNGEYDKWTDFKIPERLNEKEYYNEKQDVGYDDHRKYFDNHMDEDEGEGRKLSRKENYHTKSGFKGAGKFLNLGIQEKGTKYEQVTSFRHSGSIDHTGKHKTRYGEYDTYGTVKNYGEEKSRKQHEFEGTLSSAGKANDYEDVYGKGNKQKYGHNEAIKSVSYSSDRKSDRSLSRRDYYRPRRNRRGYDFDRD